MVAGRYPWEFIFLGKIYVFKYNWQVLYLKKEKKNSLLIYYAYLAVLPFEHFWILHICQNLTIPITNIPNNHLSFLLEQISFLLNMIVKDPSSLIEFFLCLAVYLHCAFFCEKHIWSNTVSSHVYSLKLEKKTSNSWSFKFYMDSDNGTILTLSISNVMRNQQHSVK